MKNYSLRERAEFYKRAFPAYPPLQVTQQISGMWMLGNTYGNENTLYGSYPHGYLKRILSLFPDAKRILHLFSGSLRKEDRLNEGERAFPLMKCHSINFDSFSNNADVKGDAHALPFKQDQFDLILADPPYSGEDAEHYGQPMIKRRAVLEGCRVILTEGGYVAWLDQVMPFYSGSKLTLAGVIGVIISTNHRFRVVSVFSKKMGRVINTLNL